MLPIYDHFYATPDIIQHKTCFGHIKACNDKLDINCEYTNDNSKPCMVFFYAGNQIDEHVDNDLIQEVLDVVKSNKDNVLILDTIIEDYVNPPFMACLDKILSSGVNSEKIKIVTSFNPNNMFVTRFLSLNKKYANIDIISYNGFSTSFVLNQQGKNAELNEIVARRCTKHFGLLQKNSRFLRKLVHAYFIDNGYDKQSVYSWHNEGNDSEWGKEDIKALESLNITVDINKYKQPIFYDDIYQTDEWATPQEILDDCALSIVVETSSTRDDPNSFYSETFHHRKNYFLSEKTYKNFWYGIPFIHLGMPYINERLNDQGYKTFRHLFEDPVFSIDTNFQGFKNDMKLIEKLSNMSVSEIMNILNKPDVIGFIKHNRKMLSRMLPLRNLVINLDKY